MSDQPQQQQTGIVGLGQRLINVMPPAFLMLCLINIGFLYVVLTFVEHQSAQAERSADRKIELYMRVVEQCILQGPLEGKRKEVKP